MFSKTMSMFSIISFDKSQYNAVIQNIEKSKGYISYIDSKRNRGISNKRYKEYLNTKQMLYTAKAPATDNPNSFLTYILPPGVNEEKINQLEKKYGVQDDYYIDKSLLLDKGIKSYKYQAVPIECAIFDDSLELDNRIESINRMCLSDKFIMKNHRRFFLLPFIIKTSEGGYVEPIVIANVYDVGIITVQLIINIEHNKLVKLSEGTPRSESFKEVNFYKVKENYKINDFWEKDTKFNLNADSIMNYYENQLSVLSKVKLSFNSYYRPISWVFGDFNLNKHHDHRDFIKKHASLYAGYLINGNEEVVSRMTPEELSSMLGNAQITNNSEICFYCTPTSSLLSIGYKAFLQKAQEALKDQKKDLDKSGTYQDHLHSIFRVQLLGSMMDYLRFYELTLIKRYFLKQLLDNISTGNYRTIKEYNVIKRDLNFINLQYDEEILFFTEGSPKELYKDILAKSNVSHLQSKVENMVKNIREDVSNFRDLDVKKNETLILILTSFLTILLGYRGIKFIVYDILINTPVVGDIFAKHPLRYTVSVWVVLIIVMFSLNLKRWKVNR